MAQVQTGASSTLTLERLVQQTKAINAQLTDQPDERIRQNHEQRILELQTAPTASWVNLGDFHINNGATTIVPHSLGRVPLQVLLSPPKIPSIAPGLTTGGIIMDLIGKEIDRTKQLVLFASGYGIAIDVTVSVI